MITTRQTDSEEAARVFLTLFVASAPFVLDDIATYTTQRMMHDHCTCVSPHLYEQKGTAGPNPVLERAAVGRRTLAARKCEGRMNDEAQADHHLSCRSSRARCTRPRLRRR